MDRQIRPHQSHTSIKVRSMWLQTGLSVGRPSVLNFSMLELPIVHFIIGTIKTYPLAMFSSLDYSLVVVNDLMWTCPLHSTPLHYTTLHYTTLHYTHCHDLNYYSTCIVPLQSLQMSSQKSHACTCMCVCAWGAVFGSFTSFLHLFPPPRQCVCACVCGCVCVCGRLGMLLSYFW